MGSVSQSAFKWLLIECSCDLRLHSHGSEWCIRRGQPFCHADDIRDNAPIIHGEPFPSPSKTAHNFIRNHDDPMLIAQVTHTLQVSIGWDDDTVRSSNGLNEDRSDRINTLI